MSCHVINPAPFPAIVTPDMAEARNKTHLYSAQMSVQATHAHQTSAHGWAVVRHIPLVLW